MVGLLLNWGADPSLKNNERRTPWDVAKAYGRRRVMELLDGAPSPLQMAVIREDLEAIDALLASGANPDRGDASGRTALATAVNFPEVVARLIEAGASIDIGDDGQITPLQLAARGGNLEVVTLLIDAGADPNHADRRGSTPLLAAAQNQHLDVGLRLLEAGADPNVKNRSDESPLFHVIAHRQEALLSGLLEAGAKQGAEMTNGMLALGFASSMGQEASVTALLDAGAGVDSTDGGGRTALVIAAERGHSEVVKLLLEAGARNARINAVARIPLIVALEGQNAETAMLLLESGADPNARNPAGESALEIAASIAEPELVAYLIEQNAHQVERAGARGLLAAMQRLERVSPGVTTALADRRGASRGRAAESDAEESQASLNSRYREIVHALVLAGADADWKSAVGSSAREIAARLGLREILEATAEQP